MKNLKYAWLIMMICMVGCSYNKIKIREERSVEHDKRLSVEELISLTGINQNKYSYLDLERFINEYEITSENVKMLNIPLLLEGYEETVKKINVSGIFRTSLPVRKSDYTDDVIAIAYYENRGTSTECVYYDLKNHCRYRGSDVYIFSDLNQVSQEIYENDKQLIDQLEELGVFDWENTACQNEIEDASSSVLVIKYADGTIFRMDAEGLMNKEQLVKIRNIKKVLLY